MLVALLSLAPLATPAAFAAEDDYEDLDSSGKRRPTPSEDEEGEEGKVERTEVVREIVRGLYMKSDVGMTSYVLNYGFKPQIGTSILRSGTTVSFAVGQDFVDNEKNSVAWEVAFNQGIHNGLQWEFNAQSDLPTTSDLQGDTRTFSGLANIEYSIYPSRRVGVGLRAGGGIMFAPLLMKGPAVPTDVFSAFDSSLPVHQLPHPVFFGGPTLEYYTKLSHFSVGLDADVSYALNFDLGVSALGFFKYTY